MMQKALQFTLGSLMLALGATAYNASASPYNQIPPGTIFCDLAMNGPAISAITTHTKVLGLQVSLATTQASLATTGFHGGYSFANGGIGASDGCHYFWLDIEPSTFSYKPLVWQFDNQTTTTWNAGPGLIIDANLTRPLLASSTFIACHPPTWFLYLQTGTDIPPSGCVETQLQVGTNPVIG